VALVLCGCTTPPTPIINGFPAEPGTRGSAVPVTVQGAAPAGAPAPAAAAAQTGAANQPGTYAALGRHALAVLEGEYYNGADSAVPMAAKPDF